MPSTLWNLFGLTKEQETDVEKTIGRIKSITDYVSDVMDAVKDTPLPEALKAVSPWWAGPLVESVGDAIPPVKFVIKLLEKLPEKPPARALGILACTLAYQRSAEEAVRIQPPRLQILSTSTAAGLKEQVRQLKALDADTLRGFSLDPPVAHPFVWSADAALRLVAENAGYGDDEWRRLQQRIHERFKEHLREVLTDPDTREKFTPFVEWARLGSEEDRAYHALQAHAERQRTIFDESAIFGREPFALADVYVETECGELSWGTIRGDDKHPRVDPFSQKEGVRRDVLQTVLRYLADRDFNDAIVIQGGPGSGKSAFTLRLSVELLRLGLRPLRIRLGSLPLERTVPIQDALAAAVLANDEVNGGEPVATPPRDAFLHGEIFREPIEFGNASISPYVLILDGWDEINVSVEEGFRIRVERMLEQIRNQYLGPRHPRVRVILTGRPSEAVEESSFLRESTPVLTLRPYSPKQLEQLPHKAFLSLP